MKRTIINALSNLRMTKKAQEQDYNGFKDDAERLFAAKLLLLGAAMDINNREKNSFQNLFKRSPKIYYEMAVDKNYKPFGRYYQKIGDKEESVALNRAASELAKTCVELRKINDRFKGVYGELRPDMFLPDYTMFKSDPGAMVSIMSGDEDLGWTPEQEKKAGFLDWFKATDNLGQTNNADSSEGPVNWDPNAIDASDADFAYMIRGPSIRH